MAGRRWVDWVAVGVAASALGVGGWAMPAGAASAPDHGADRASDRESAKHVLLISVDGLHQSDLSWYVQHHPGSALAALAGRGTEYTNAQTPFPSDSFPGMVAQVTGGDPSSTGVYYDDTYNRALLPAGTTDCRHAAPGTEVTYFEALDKNPAALDAGQGIVPAPGSDPFAAIAKLSSDPKTLIDPVQLPVDPATCKPVYPNQYLQVNTVFEVAHEHGLHTAWSDKHPAFQILAGPSGTGVDDFFTPEINSSANPAAPTDPSQPDWTKDNLATQQYDSYKVAALLEWIDGHAHDGSGHPGTPAIFGMNFQSVSTAQKLPTSRTEGDTSGQATGGYLADGVTPGPVLANALDYVDQSIGRMVERLRHDGQFDSTAIVVSAKHGQSPTDPAALNRIDDGMIVDALNAAWNHDHQGGDPRAVPLVAFNVDDDGMLLWLHDRSTIAESYVHDFLLHYNDGAASVDGKPVVAAGLRDVDAGQSAAQLLGVPFDDPRVPDVVGIAQYGVVYTGHKAKIAEHGGDDPHDRNVPILIAGPRTASGMHITTAVETTQIAPTILELLGLNPDELQAVHRQHTSALPS